MISPSAPVVEDQVWIHSRVLILPGVRIGHHDVIGGYNVVTKDIPPHCITVCNPARIVGSVAHRGGNQEQDAHSYCNH